MEAAVGRARALHGIGPGIDREHHAGLRREHALEQRDRDLEWRPRESGACERGGVLHGRACEHPEHHRAFAKLVGQLERAIQDHRRDPGERGIGQHAGHDLARVCGHALLRGGAQRGEVGLVERAERLDEPRVDLGLGQRAVGRRRTAAGADESSSRGSRS